MMKTYIGYREKDGRAIVRIEDGEKVWLLPHPRLHSPTGLEWGYGGSGPADLALSILIDFFGEGHLIPPRAYDGFLPSAMEAIESTKAWRIHHSFKFLIIANLPRAIEAHVPYAEAAVAEVLPPVEVWRLTEEDVRRHVQTIIDLERRCLNCLSFTSQEGQTRACMNPRCPHSPWYSEGANGKA